MGELHRRTAESAVNQSGVQTRDGQLLAAGKNIDTLLKPGNLAWSKLLRLSEPQIPSNIWSKSIDVFVSSTLISLFVCLRCGFPFLSSGAFLVIANDNITTARVVSRQTITIDIRPGHTAQSG